MTSSVSSWMDPVRMVWWGEFIFPLLRGHPGPGSERIGFRRITLRSPVIPGTAHATLTLLMTICNEFYSSLRVLLSLLLTVSFAVPLF